jgi:hypothetical protein
MSRWRLRSTRDPPRWSPVEAPCRSGRACREFLGRVTTGLLTERFLSRRANRICGPYP